MHNARFFFGQHRIESAFVRHSYDGVEEGNSVRTVTDKELLAQLRRGRRDALRRVYERYKDAMLALAMTLCRDRPTAEDVVHDVFVAFAGLAPTLLVWSNLRRYLLTAVVNRVRSLKRRSQNNTDLADNGAGGHEAFDPAGSVMTAELLEHAYRAVTELPYEQRETIVLRLQAGLSFKQIARVQAVPIGTVLSRYRYGVAKLRQRLDREVVR